MAVKGGKGEIDWPTFLALTRELSKESPDVDWFKLAEEAGAFAQNKVPRTTPAEMVLRVNTVADWIAWQWTDGQMRLEACQRWGAQALTLYRTRAAKVIAWQPSPSGSWMENSADGCYWKLENGGGVPNWGRPSSLFNATTVLQAPCKPWRRASEETNAKSSGI
jgi:hypothetical protein